MYFDLNVPVPAPASQPQVQVHASKKNKGKQSAVQAQQQPVVFSAAQLAKLESRIDLLVRLGYTVLAFNQTVISKFDPRSHVNVLDPLLKQLRKREGILFLKRLTIVLDEDSEKGNGLSAGNASLLSPYDILALHPTTQTSLASACLTHSQPSPVTTHIISLPLTAPRLPFRLKHTLVRTAIKNGAVFEIDYAGALGAGVEDDRRNWWAAACELARATKGKGLIVSGGADAEPYLRAPADVGNLITLLGLAQNLAHDAAATTPKSLILRAQTRRTYRAVLSEPVLVMPENHSSEVVSQNGQEASVAVVASKENGIPSQSIKSVPSEKDAANDAVSPTKPDNQNTGPRKDVQGNGTKRSFDTISDDGVNEKKDVAGGKVESRKKKKKLKKVGNDASLN